MLKKFDNLDEEDIFIEKWQATLNTVQKTKLFSPQNPIPG